MRWLAILQVLLLVACSNPMNAPVPKELSGMESLKPALEKLKPDERELFAGYVVRHTVGAEFGKAFGIKSEPIPDGMTVGKAIEEQRAFVERQKAEATAKKAAQEKLEAERKALAEQIKQVLLISLRDLSLHKATFKDMDVKSRIDITFDFENKGAKDITGLKGKGMFRDKFGDTVSGGGFKVEQTLPAGKTTTILLSRNFNQFDDEDRKLANADAANLTFEFVPETILFADGSKFEAPKPVKE